LARCRSSQRPRCARDRRHGRAAAGFAATAIKKGRELGTVEAGKIADVIAVKGDPLADIRPLHERKNIGLVGEDRIVYVDHLPGKSKEAIDGEPDSRRFIER
jgi:antitoxin (DNA-binding transcriptional repressor) of toxin-antitoxin stability system